MAPGGRLRCNRCRIFRTPNPGDLRRFENPRHSYAGQPPSTEITFVFQLHIGSCLHSAWGAKRDSNSGWSVGASLR
jgi:hypothetical protein